MPKQAVPTGAKLSPSELNAMQRQSVLSRSIEMVQQIFSTTLAVPANTPQINVQPRNVGLIKRFIVEITGTVANGAAGAITLSDFGLANLLSNVTFTDLNNNVRLNTPGWLLALVANMKKRSPYAGGFSLASVGTSPQGLMENSGLWPVIVAPPTVAISTNSAFRAVFEIPLAYSDDDLRGAVYANVVNATMNLQLSLNTGGAFVAAGADSTTAVYSGNATNASFTNVTVTVYQVYLDQLPIGKSGVVLPILDLSTVYELKSSNFSGIVAGQEFPVPYANFRDFLSTTAVYVNAAAGTRVTGADINYFALQAANFTNVWKKDPLLLAQDARAICHGDLPNGTYHFSSRRKPISTTQYGNMELVVNPITAAAGAYLLVGWEDFAMVNTLTQAGSLAG